jgi:hypothetical protein
MGHRRADGKSCGFYAQDQLGRTPDQRGGTCFRLFRNGMSNPLRFGTDRGNRKLTGPGFKKRRQAKKTGSKP